jgi:GNAT superfamily N-acetyltransferase
MAHGEPPIRRMTRADSREVVAVTARAFWHDPLFDFFSRDLLHEYRLLPVVFKADFADLRRSRAELWVAERDGRPRGVAGWLPPGGYPRPPLHEAARTLRAAAVLARGRRRLKALRLLLEVDRHHPAEPHWYLALLATDPTSQGRGMGSALLAPILRQCDEHGTIAYTETQKEDNVGWYARAGFAVAHEIRFPDTPPVWCLQREPRA